MFDSNEEDIVYDKILLLYILKNAETELTNSQLTQIVLDNKIMNYFYLQTLVSELLDNDLIKIFKDTNKETYMLDSEAIQMLEVFEKDIPQSLKNKIINYLRTHKEELSSDQAQIKCGYIKHSDSEFTVNLRVLEKKTSLIDINLNVPSEAQAEKICDSWKNNASTAFSEIITLLTKER